MFREMWDAIRACLVTFAVCAIAYPAVVFGIGHTLFPRQAEGSLIERDGKVVGSELIAQPFGSEKYFQPRPSAAGSSGYAADAASGSNLGTKNPALRDRIMVDVAKQVVAHGDAPTLQAKLDRLDATQAELKAKNEIKEKSQADTDAIPKLEEAASAAKSDLAGALGSLAKTVKTPVPADLVTTSGAGLDPEISVEAADYQASRVASARGADVAKVRALIAEHTRHSGALIGAPARVNVLLLNLTLDEKLPVRAGTAEAKPEAAAPARAESSEATPAPVAAAPAPAPAQAEPSEARPDPLTVLASRIDKIQERLDAAPVDALSADLKGVKAQIARLAEVPADSARMSRRLAELDGRLDTLGREVGEARSQAKAASAPTGDRDKVAALEAQVRTMRDDLAKLRDAAARPEVAAARPVLDLGPARKLFRDRQYAAASTAFRALTSSHPDDARAWYYAALANGFATGQWRGETEELVTKGMDRERAGTPPAAEIDASLADVAAGSGREWLSFYRQRASAKP